MPKQSKAKQVQTNDSPQTQAINEQAKKQTPCPFDCIVEHRKGEWWGTKAYERWLLVETNAKPTDGG